MNEHRTLSILQRLPLILAITAASYGLPAQAQGTRAGANIGATVVTALTAPSPQRVSDELGAVRR